MGLGEQYELKKTENIRDEQSEQKSALNVLLSAITVGVANCGANIQCEKIAGNTVTEQWWRGRRTAFMEMRKLIERVR